jgi:hypothetical protein
MFFYFVNHGGTMGTDIRTLRSKGSTIDELVAATPDAIIINKLKNKDERELMSANIARSIKSNFDIRPTCRCGSLQEYISLGTDTKCPICNSPVSQDNSELKPILFFRAPPDIDTLLLPVFLTMFKNSFHSKGFCVARWLVDRAYDKREPTITNPLIEAGIERGWNYFTNNLEMIMGVLLTVPSIRVKITTNAKDTLQYYRENKDLIHTKHIAFPSSILTIVEDTAVGKYLDFNFSTLIDVGKSLMGVDFKRSREIRENIIGRNMIAMCDFYTTYFKTVFQGKKGLFRTGLMSAKGAHVMRTVITGITEPHRYDEIHVSWTPFIHMMSTHIVSKLLRRDYTLSEAHRFIQVCSSKYDTEMHEILKELIREAGPKGIPVSMQRFPSLTTGSMLLVYITEVLIHPGTYVSRISLLICPSLNADRLKGK